MPVSPSGTEQKRSGLTGPRTAGQFVVVMAASVGPKVAQHENLQGERNARAGIQAGGDGAMPSQAQIQCE